GAMRDVDDEVRGYIDQRTLDREVRRAVALVDDNPGEAGQILTGVARLADDIGNRDMARFIRSALRELQTTGAISDESRKTIGPGGRTRTLRADHARSLEGIPEQALDEARRR